MSSLLTVPQLPHEVLVHILSFVPFKKRFSTCALVHSSWQAAACAATTSISLKCDGAVAQQLATSCMHATSLSLEASTRHHPSLQLSLPQLHRLQLSGFTVPTLSQPGGIVHGCQHLRELILTDCILPRTKALSALTALTALTRLGLCGVCARGESPDLRPLGAMAGLQELELDTYGLRSLHKLLAPSSSSSDSSPVLPGLTKLVLQSSSYTPEKLQPERLSSLRCLDLQGVFVPRWTSLTGLQELRLQTFDIEAHEWRAMLAGAQLPQLTQLHLEGSPTMCGDALQQLVEACPGIQVLQLGGKGDDSEYSANVIESPGSLQLLAQLRHMTRLTLYSTDRTDFSALPELQQLRDLSVGGHVLSLDLLPLTRLTGLTRFSRDFTSTGITRCFGDYVSYASAWEDCYESELAFDLQAGPVWQQIMDFCENNEWSTAIGDHVRPLRSQLAEAQDTISRQQQQLEEQAAELAALRAQLSLRQQQE